jgi:hypothetical protein
MISPIVSGQLGQTQPDRSNELAQLNQLRRECDAITFHNVPVEMPALNEYKKQQKASLGNM